MAENCRIFGNLLAVLVWLALCAGVASAQGAGREGVGDRRAQEALKALQEKAVPTLAKIDAAVKDLEDRRKAELREVAASQEKDKAKAGAILKAVRDAVTVLQRDPRMESVHTSVLQPESVSVTILQSETRTALANAEALQRYVQSPSPPSDVSQRFARLRQNLAPAVQAGARVRSVLSKAEVAMKKDMTPDEFNAAKAGLEKEVEAAVRAAEAALVKGPGTNQTGRGATPIRLQGYVLMEPAAAPRSRVARSSDSSQPKQVAVLLSCPSSLFIPTESEYFRMVLDGSGAMIGLRRDHVVDCSPKRFSLLFEDRTVRALGVFGEKEFRAGKWAVAGGGFSAAIPAAMELVVVWNVEARPPMRVQVDDGAPQEVPEKALEDIGPPGGPGPPPWR